MRFLSPGGASRGVLVARVRARCAPASASGVVGGGCRVWVRLVGGPPPPRPRSCPPSPPAAARPPPGRRQRGGLAGASASFPSGSLPCAARGWCVFFLPGGGRGVVARRPSRHPWRGALALTVAGSRCRVTGRCRGSARPSSSPRFLASRVRPAPVRVPSCRVPARRFKDPRGGRPSAPGVGGRWGP